jgi:hypothetical protein
MPERTENCLSASERYSRVALKPVPVGGWQCHGTTKEIEIHRKSFDLDSWARFRWVTARPVQERFVKCGRFITSPWNLSLCAVRSDIPCEIIASGGDTADGISQFRFCRRSHASGERRDRGAHPARSRESRSECATLRDSDARTIGASQPPLALPARPGPARMRMGLARCATAA